MITLSSVVVDLPSGTHLPIGEPQSGPSELTCEKGEVCSFVCVTLPCFQAAGELRITITVETDLPDNVPVSVSAQELIGPIVGDIPETAMAPCRPGHRSAKVTLTADALVRAGVQTHQMAWQWHARIDKGTVEPLSASRHDL